MPPSDEGGGLPPILESAARRRERQTYKQEFEYHRKEINSCLSYFAFLQKSSKTLWKEGTFFLLRSRSMPFAKGERCSFLCTKEKSQKKCATLQVDRSANQRSRKGASPILFLLRSDSKSSAEGVRLTFLYLKEKLQKKQTTLQVDRLRQSTVPQGLFCFRRYGAFRGSAPVPESKAIGFLAAAPILQI